MKNFITMQSVLFDAYYDEKGRTFQQYCLDVHGVDITLLPSDRSSASALFSQVVNNENEFELPNDSLTIPKNAAFAVSATKENKNAVFYDDLAKHVLFRGEWVVNPKINTLTDIDLDNVIYINNPYNEIVKIQETRIRGLKIKQGLERSGYRATGRKVDVDKHNRILELSKSDGITKEEISKAVGVSVPTVYRVLRSNIK